MNVPLEQRMLEADRLWRRGDAFVEAGDGAAAYRLYTEAHDLIMDCPSLHERAHRKLARVSARHGHRGEIVVDKLLAWLAPLGVFEAIAMAQRSSVTFAAACRRRLAAH
ncbi:hypothetical protein [Solimonas marina]|uniref:Uncharacterized protein n=1 Tax=Solimonas marina TaxID=2714601 RepID=A0A969W7A5_9GAMM|nr:hypothetical protein [Solimonas marina]NKF20839.1 hypothetical protein [Solimonas marina]